MGMWVFIQKGHVVPPEKGLVEFGGAQLGVLVAGCSVSFLEHLFWASGDALQLTSDKAGDD